MKIFTLVGILFLSLSLSGCSLFPSGSIRPSSPLAQTNFELKSKNVEPPLSPFELAEEKVIQLDAFLASQKMFSYDLPNASTVITKREISGYLDANKSGKITRTVVGLATVAEHFYYEKGTLIFVRVDTESPSESGTGKTKQIQEMHFVDGKMLVHLQDGKLVDDASINQFVEQQSLKDAEFILNDFVMRKEMASDTCTTLSDCDGQEMSVRGTVATDPATHFTAIHEEFENINYITTVNDGEIIVYTKKPLRGQKDQVFEFTGKVVRVDEETENGPSGEYQLLANEFKKVNE